MNMQEHALESSAMDHSTQIQQSSNGNPGLYNAIRATTSVSDPLWIGTLCPTEFNESNDALRETLRNSYNAITVNLTKEELDGHYNIFCKQVLWKPFHYQLEDYPKGTNYEEMAWKQYIAVNQKFAQTIVENYKEGDIIWINDYHLMLVPEMVRKAIPTATIGFFLHIPFPSSEIFRCLQVRKQILHGLLGADLIGFQTYGFMRHFIMTCSRILALDSNPKGIQLANSTVDLGIYPIGINLQSLNEKRQQEEVLTLVKSLKQKYAGKKVLIGRDKNDYVKGVRHKLVAFERFLSQHPEWHGKVVLIQVALSTTEANETESNVSDIVAEINSKYGTIEYLPVVYLHQDISFSHYLALMTMADGCLITPLRDGMNLTSHEYVVCQEEKRSPLIISEFAGTYGSFGASLRVNPWDAQEVADAINEALLMSEEEKTFRWRALYQYISTNTAQKYVETFLQDLCLFHNENIRTLASSIPPLSIEFLSNEYRSCSKRLILLDDCGTLRKPCVGEVHFEDPRMTELLVKLCSDPMNTVYLLSGRCRSELESLMQIPNLGLSAESGCFLKLADKSKWSEMLRDENINSWRKKVLEIFEYYAETPGSYIEMKEVGLSWHYGHADQEFGAWQAAECQNHIVNTLQSLYPIHTLATKKRIDVIPRNVSKATIVRRVLQYHQNRRSLSVHATSATSSLASECRETANSLYNGNALFSNEVDGYVNHDSGHMSDSSFVNTASLFDFILCIGDDRADEVMFEYLAKLDEGLNSEMTSYSEAVSPIEDDSPRKRTPSPHRMNKPKILTCTVGRKSSAAKWFIESIDQVLEGLNSTIN